MIIIDFLTLEGTDSLGEEFVPQKLIFIKFKIKKGIRPRKTLAKFEQIILITNICKNCQKKSNERNFGIFDKHSENVHFY